MEAGKSNGQPSSINASTDTTRKIETLRKLSKTLNEPYLGEIADEMARVYRIMIERGQKGKNMRADLLIRGAELLEADAAKADGVRFDLWTWMKPYDYMPCLYDRVNYKPQLNCGTKACAMGLFCLSGAFKEEGLSHTTETLTPICNDRLGYGAAAELFGITFDEAECLFSPEAYPHNETTGAVGELAVAARIRSLVAGEDIVSLYMPSEEEDDEE